MKLLHLQSKHGLSSDKTPNMYCGEDNRKYPCNGYLLVTNSGQPHDTVVYCLPPATRILSLAFGVLLTINYIHVFYSHQMLTLKLYLPQLSGSKQTKLSIKTSHHLLYKTFYHRTLFLRLTRNHLRSTGARAGKNLHFIDDDKFHLSFLRSCDTLKFSRHMHNIVSRSTNYALTASELDFDLHNDHEKQEDNALSVKNN